MGVGFSGWNFLLKPEIIPLHLNNDIFCVVFSIFNINSAPPNLGRGLNSLIFEISSGSIQSGSSALSGFGTFLILDYWIESSIS